MNQVIGIMSKALDASSLRQKVISNNIANVDTPGFQPMQVSFEDMLRQEINGGSFTGLRTDAKHLVIGSTDGVPSPEVTKENTTMTSSGNGVDLDYEMTEMSKNSLWYQSLAYGMNQELNLIKMSIK